MENVIIAKLAITISYLIAFYKYMQLTNTMYSIA